MSIFKYEPSILIGLLLSFILLILKLFFISDTHLIDDEAYYAIWSRHLGPGYIEHGPGTAWFIRFSTFLFGESGFGVRAIGTFSFLALSYLGYLFFKNIRDERVGLVWVILLNLTPFFFGVTFILTPDTPMVLFLFLMLFAYHHAIFKDSRYYWLAGALLGVATLSKIPAAFLGIGVLLYHFLSKDRRKHLANPHMWGGFVLSVLIYAPFIFWNMNNEWAFAKFVMYVTDKVGNWKTFGDLWAAQAGLFLPTLFFPMVIFIFLPVFRYFKREKNLKGLESEEYLFFSLTSLVPFMYLAYKSTQNKLEANWPLVVFLGVFCLAVIWFGKNLQSKKIRFLFITHFMIAGIGSLIVLLHALFGILPIARSLDVTSRYYKFKTITQDFKDFYHAEMSPDLRIMSFNYQIPSYVNFYLNPELEAICVSLGNYHPTAYDIWHDEKDLKGKNYYLLVGGDQTPDKAVRSFESLEKIKTFSSMRDEINVGAFTLFLAKNYLGKQTSK